MPTAACVHHVAYTFENIDDLLDRYVLLRDQEITPAVCIAHGVTTSMYYQDPDANFVEMQIDNFATPADATNYMRGPEYAGDSVGPAFDPEAMLAARRGGTRCRGTHRPRMVAASRLARSDVDSHRRVKNTPIPRQRGTER